MAQEKTEVQRVQATKAKVKQENRAKVYLDKLNKMKGDRGTYDDTVQQVSDRVLPRKGYVTQTKVKGEKTDPTLYDVTAVFANQTMASGLFSYLCSQKWFGLKAKTKELNEPKEHKDWFSNVGRIVLEELATSNFNLEIYELLLDIGWCGTPLILVEDGKDTWLNFSTKHVSDYWLAEDSKGKVDTVYIMLRYTARQAVQEWGVDNVGKTVRDAFNSTDQKKINEEYLFLWVIEPRADYDHNYPTLKSRQPIASVYIAIKDIIIVKESGFYEMPAFAPRWNKLSGEVMGRSQGMFALPEIKMANNMRKVVIKAGELAVSPSILAPDDGFIGPVRTAPRSIIYYRKTLQGRDKPEVFNSGSNPQIGRELVMDSQEIIKKAFFNDLFILLMEHAGTQKTAYETAKIIQEKYSMVIAPVGRLQSELFGGMVRRCVAILGRAGRLPPVPAGLVGQEYEVEYLSKLALALRVIEIQAFADAMEVTGPMATAKPELMDNYDEDEITRGIAERLGVPVEWVRDITERDEIRGNRAEKQAAMEAAQLAIEGAKVVPGLNKKAEAGSPAAALAEG